LRRTPSLAALLLCAALACPAFADEENGLTAGDATLVSAFDAIQDRALEAVAIGPLAFDAISALATIDPALRVEQLTSRRIGLHYAGRLATQYPAPAADDPDGWAAIAEHMISEARTLSPLVAQADPEHVRAVMMDAALAHLDRFSRYAPPTEAEEHRANRSGFGGIGVRLEPHESDITLLEVLPNTPASKAHLRAGDHILAIDGQSVGGLSQDAVSKLIRGPVASAISLTIRTQGQQKASVITLTRDHIVPPTVALEATQDGVATITLSGFTEASGGEMFKALAALSGHRDLKGVILDLRGNPGGLLDQAVAIADLFIAEGPIVSTRGRHPDSLQAYEARPGDLAERVPLVVLVDGRTASAAEILAAALQDSGRAVIIGSNSYGKGTVQTVLSLPNHGELTLTWSRYYAPSGYSLHELGVLPTLCSEGASSAAEAQALLDGLDAPDNTLPAQMAVWRASKVEQTELRHRLRLSCPAENRLTDAATKAFDTTLARRLLHDDALYHKAVSLASGQNLQIPEAKTTSSP
jgi:carboxyl-terminal processing protease